MPAAALRVAGGGVRLKPALRGADNSRAMPAPPPPAATEVLSALFVTLAAITGAGCTLRVLKRRERRQARVRVDDLVRSLCEFIEHRLSPHVLAQEAAAAAPDVFWAALEDQVTRRSGWLALSRALVDNPHFAAEREALLDKSPWRRELAARRLGLLFSPESRRALRRALRDGPGLVAATAAAALARYRDLEALRWLLANPAALERRTHRPRVTLLRAFGRRALPDLAAALDRGTGDAAMDRALIEALGLAGHREARRSIERRLRDGDVEQRIAAARALGQMRADDCATTLMGALQDEAWQVRAQAARALGRTRAGIAMLALPARLTDPAWWVRRHAAYALREFGMEGRRELERIAHGSPDPYARDMAREVLEGWPDAA
jgi:HEAT repeat protein